MTIWFVVLGFFFLNGKYVYNSWSNFNLICWMKHRYVGNNLTWLLKEKGLVKQTCDFLNVSRPTEKSRPSFIGKAYSGHQQVKKKMGREIIIPEERERERERVPSIGTAKRKERRRGGVWNCVWKKKLTKEKEKKKTTWIYPLQGLTSWAPFKPI